MTINADHRLRWHLVQTEEYQNAREDETSFPKSPKRSDLSRANRAVPALRLVHFETAERFERREVLAAGIE